MENLPKTPEEVVDILAKTKLLKVEDESGSITLEAHNQVNIQPKGTPFGAKLKLESDGSVTPTLTFDSKKMRPVINRTDPKQALDDALEDYLNGMEGQDKNI
ncbi:MAG: hypothetical protein ACO242_06115 [Candidatus Fonsibacter ubiquis]